MLTLYNVVSSDGYIMTKDGDESFIPDSLWPTVLDVFRRYDVILMGRRTYEAFEHYGAALLEPFDRLPIRKVVISRDGSFRPKPGYEAATDPVSILRENERVVVSSGPGFNDYLFRAKLVDKIVLHTLPATLGDGIRAFDDGFLRDFALESRLQKDMVEETVFVRSLPAK